jgi:hypothetical protein
LGRARDEPRAAGCAATFVVFFFAATFLVAFFFATFATFFFEAPPPASFSSAPAPVVLSSSAMNRISVRVFDSVRGFDQVETGWLEQAVVGTGCIGRALREPRILP